MANAGGHEDSGRPTVVKFALAGWLLVKRRLRERLRPGSDVTHKIEALPLVGLYWSAGSEHCPGSGLDLDIFGCPLSPGDEVVGVLPAPPGSYCVKCFPWGRAAGIAEPLGYEFPGADAPDWQRLCEMRREELDKMGDGDEERTAPAQ